MNPNIFKSKLYRKNNNTCHGAQLGWDYTPLFKYLLSKVGLPWKEVYKDVKARVNSTVPIYWMVNRYKNVDSLLGYIRVGESTYYSSLYVDDKGILQFVDKSINENTLEPSCNCCTHTFNGKRFTKKYKEKPILDREFIGNLNSSIKV
jgi:hypothetical protein